jgi:hypothetical protein
MLVLLAGGGALSLVAATFWIAFLNWNQKIFWNVLSSILVGIAAALIAIFSQLKSEETRARDTALIVFDRQNGLPLTTFPDRASSDLHNSYSTLTKIFLSSPGAGRKLEDRTDEAIGSDGAELLEAFVLVGVSDTQYAGFGMHQAVDESGVWRVKAILTGGRVPPPPQSELRKMSDLWPKLSHNRFAVGTAKNEFWDDIVCRLPEGTAVSSTRTTDGARDLVFHKPSFFKLTFRIKQLGTTPGAFPNTYVPAGNEQPIAALFSVDVISHFDRITSQNQQTESLKSWTQGLTAEVLQKLPH